MKLYKQNRYKGGVKANRNNPKCYSKQNLKEILVEKIQSGRKLSFSRKPLSLDSPYNRLGISINLKNLLKIGTSGDISTGFSFKSTGNATLGLTGAYMTNLF